MLNLIVFLALNANAAAETTHVANNRSLEVCLELSQSYNLSKRAFLQVANENFSREQIQEILNYSDSVRDEMERRNCDSRY